METKALSKKYVEENYVHKDKIREVIEKLKIEKNFYFEKQVIQGKIDLLEAILNESEDK